MERANTFFGALGQIIKNSLRWVILLGRKYQIVAALYLVIFCVSIIGYANQPVTPPSSPVPPSNSNPPPVPNPNPSPASPSTPAPAPAIDVASVKVYKNDNFLTIRFDKPVASVELVVDEQSINADCKPDICTTSISQESRQLQVFWSQGQENFRANFRL
jgi:hypothetical protein